MWGIDKVSLEMLLDAGADLMPDVGGGSARGSGEEMASPLDVPPSPENWQNFGIIFRRATPEEEEAGKRPHVIPPPPAGFFDAIGGPA